MHFLMEHGLDYGLWVVSFPGGSGDIAKWGYYGLDYETPGISWIKSMFPRYILL